MFGKARCKACGDKVRFALKHLSEKHPELYASAKGMPMPKIMDKYFETD